MSRYFPGPWFADRYKVKCVTHGRELTLGLASNTRFTPEARAAHARLMAKAPEMYELLTELRDAWLDQNVADVEGILTGDVLTDLLEYLK